MTINDAVAKGMEIMEIAGISASSDDYDDLLVMVVWDLMEEQGRVAHR
jgi:hypothetical protein